MSWRETLPTPRGRLLFDEPLAPFTWLRVGGPAEVLFLPANPEDLSGFLRALPPEIPVTILGVGSNLIVRDRGIAGVVVRLAGRSFAEISVDTAANRILTRSGALDSAVARAGAGAGLAGLEFLAGIPGTIGGALTMNAGCYGRETRDVLVSASGLDRFGTKHTFDVSELGYRYRGNTAPEGIIWIGAVLQGRPDDPAAIAARMAEITDRRETSQPVRERTGGSTFKNPPGDSAWRLIDAAGWRGKAVRGAMFSPLHANFLINTGEATAAALEDLAETVRTDIAEKFGVALEWEVKRIGRR